MYTETKIGYKPIDYEGDYINNQLRIELERLELVRKKRRKSARNSFVDWMRDIAQVGRAVGYHIMIPKIKIVRLYKWLFDDR